MAEAKFSGIGVVNMNGSVGNTTFARNFYGTYAKNRAGTPAGSAFLTAWQNEVSNLASVWEFGLSDSDRQTWYNVSRTSVDSMADRNEITGYDLYMSVNLNLFMAGGLPTISPPLSMERMQIPQPIIGAHTTLNLEISIPQTTLVRVALYFTKGLPPGRMSNNQIYAFSVARNLNNVPQNIIAEYTTRIGALISGTKVFIKLVPISQFSGLRGQPQYASVIIS